MDAIFISLDKGFIQYGIDKINVIIDKNEVLWFSGKETTLALGYVNTRDALQKHVEDYDKIRLKDIKMKNKRGHPDTVYINEAGLYSLVTRSNLPAAKKFQYWVFHDVLPSIRKYGKYQLKKEYENERNAMITRLRYIEKEYELMKRDLKKDTYPDGALVYVIDYSTKSKPIYRIGKTIDMKKRKTVHDTHMLHKRNVVLMKETTNPIRLETCLRVMLYDYQYKDRTDFYLCDLSEIKKAMTKCLRSFNQMNKSNRNKSGSKNQRGGNPNHDIMWTKINALKLYVNRLNDKIDKLDTKLYC